MTDNLHCAASALSHIKRNRHIHSMLSMLAIEVATAHKSYGGGFQLCIALWRPFRRMVGRHIKESCPPHSLMCATSSQVARVESNALPE